MADDNNESSRMSIRTFRADQISALIWLAVGIVVVYQSRKLDYTAMYGPGPGFLPFWLGVGVIALGIALFFKAALLDNKKQNIEMPTRLASLQIILVVAAIFGFNLVAETVGFILSIGLLFFFILFIVERRGWKISLVMAIVNPVFIWLVFELGLDMRFPPGLLGMFR